LASSSLIIPAIPENEGRACHCAGLVKLAGEYRAMKSFASAICILVLALGADCLTAQNGAAVDVSRYGPYPANFKEIVTKWLATQLLDPASAKIEWEGDAKPADLGTNGQHLYGYVVNFKINSRNRFGAYTGKQEHGALIRNGEVIKGMGFGY
jgi:hypothetical protein